MEVKGFKIFWERDRKRKNERRKSTNCFVFWNIEWILNLGNEDKKERKKGKKNLKNIVSLAWNSTNLSLGYINLDFAEKV